MSQVLSFVHLLILFFFNCLWQFQFFKTLDHVVNLKMPDGVGVGAKVPGLYPIMSSTKGSLSGITAWGAV